MLKYNYCSGAIYGDRPTLTSDLTAGGVAIVEVEHLKNGVHCLLSTFTEQFTVKAHPALFKGRRVGIGRNDEHFSSLPDNVISLLK